MTVILRIILILSLVRPYSPAYAEGENSSEPLPPPPPVHVIKTQVDDQGRVVGFHAAVPAPPADPTSQKAIWENVMIEVGENLRSPNKALWALTRMSAGAFVIVQGLMIEGNMTFAQAWPALAAASFLAAFMSYSIPVTNHWYPSLNPVGLSPDTELKGLPRIINGLLKGYLFIFLSGLASAAALGLPTEQGMLGAVEAKKGTVAESSLLFLAGTSFAGYGFILNRKLEILRGIPVGVAGAHQDRNQQILGAICFGLVKGVLLGFTLAWVGVAAVTAAGLVYLMNCMQALNREKKKQKGS